MDIITIDKGRIRYTLKANDYPEGYRHLHQHDPDFGKRVPAWWLLVDRQPVLWKNGETNWDSIIEPTILDLVAKKVAGGGTVSGVIP